MKYSLMTLTALGFLTSSCGLLYGNPFKKCSAIGGWNQIDEKRDPKIEVKSLSNWSMISENKDKVVCEADALSFTGESKKIVYVIRPDSSVEIDPDSIEFTERSAQQNTNDILFKGATDAQQEVKEKLGY